MTDAPDMEPALERDLYEVANQLEGYVGPDTPEPLAQFLLREGREAAKLADEIVRLRAARSAPEAGKSVDETLQARVQPWMMACFGREISSDRVERGDRLLEEVFELLQSGGYDPARVLALRDYVWGREAGEPFQEVGGVMITLAAYCLAHGLNMHEAGETELARIWTKVDKIRAKQAAKPVGSALPVALASSPAPTGAEPVAWTGSGSIARIEAGLEGHIWPERADAHPIPLYGAPQPVALPGAEPVAWQRKRDGHLINEPRQGYEPLYASPHPVAPTGEIAGLVERLNRGIAYLPRTAAEDSTEYEAFRKLGDAILVNEGDFWMGLFVMSEAAAALTASEAEATDLRRKLEEAERERVKNIEIGGELVYQMNRAKAAERKLGEAMEILAEARERINRYADTAAEHDLVARIDALSGASQ